MFFVWIVKVLVRVSGRSFWCVVEVLVVAKSKFLATGSIPSISLNVKICVKCTFILVVEVLLSRKNGPTPYRLSISTRRQIKFAPIVSATAILVISKL